MNTKLIATALVAIVSVTAFAGEKVKLTVKFGGALKGITGMDDWELQAVKSPRDAASGLATGRRQHMPLVLRSAYQENSSLQKALCTNEVLENVMIQKPATGRAKAQAGILSTPKLVGYNIVRIDGKLYQEVSFTYQKITWTDQ